MSTTTDLAALLALPDFPRSATYDPRWVLDNQMGPNALWLTEWLAQDLALEPGMRVLDMGCGKGLSSVFLAREYGLQVWAADLWIGPGDNWQRIRQAGLEDRVFPVKVEARALPFAPGFFDAIICVDSYIYYGTDDLYLGYFQQFVKPGGQLAVAHGALNKDFEGDVPEHLKPFWGQDCWGWHTMAWWRHLWERTGLVTIEVADMMPDGCARYLRWKQARVAGGEQNPSLQTDIAVLEADAGEYLGFVRLIARRNP
jgi:cyclopropane fatty-acyl-phospholipid synthase-like methyltransferase